MMRDSYSPLFTHYEPQDKEKMTHPDLSRRREQGFTLVELLVVMAITVILLGLIFGPLVQGFNLTNRARVQVLAQDTARRTMEDVQRELSNAVFLFDNSNEPINLWFYNENNEPVALRIPFAMIDIVPPAREQDQNAQLNQNQIDPTTGLAIDRGDVALPLAPGRVLVRYWLGLRDNTSDRDPTDQTSGIPRKSYWNFYDNTRSTQRGFSDHNPVLLYRAVVSPYLPTGQVDTRLFRVSPQGQPILYDPNFFYDAADATIPANSGLSSAALPGWRDKNGDGRVNIGENWAAIARVMVPADRADEVSLDRDEQRQIIYYNGVPRATPHIRFQPTYVGNDNGAATSVNDTGNESPNLAPSTYAATNGHWTLPYGLYIFRSALSDNPLRFFYAEGRLASGQIAPGGNGVIYYREYDTVNNTLIRNDPVAGFPLDANGHLSPADARPEIMFTVDARRGLVNFAFPDSIVLHDSQGNPQPSRFAPEEVNQRFDTANTAGQNAYRYISLAALDTLLNPGVQSPLTQIPNVRIVPGSEVVKGPDMRPGPHYGKEITYTRLPADTPPQNIGLNEYTINYTDRPNTNANLTQDEQALLRMGTIVFSSLKNNEPYEGAVNSLPTQDADGNPAARITVTYQIQNNFPTDVVKLDYLTRHLMTFVLGVRLYDLGSGQPQQVTLTQKIRVRNLQR